VTGAASVLLREHMDFGVPRKEGAGDLVRRWHSVVEVLRHEVAGGSCSCDGGVEVPQDKEMMTCRCEGRCQAWGVARMVRCSPVQGVRCAGELALVAQEHHSGEEGVGGEDVAQIHGQAYGEGMALADVAQSKAMDEEQAKAQVQAEGAEPGS
jgi:hypothetical protein